MLTNLIRKSLLILCFLLLLSGLTFSNIHSKNSPRKPNATSIKGRNLGPKDGYVAGKAIDTASGQPLTGTIVRLVKAAGSAVTSPLEATADQHGRYGFAAPQGLAAVEVTKEGYISAYREFRVQAETVVKPFDAWLSPIATATPFNPLVGANLSLQDNKIELEIPPSAFSGEFNVSLTRLGYQALPMPLPPGWAPLSVVHLGPEGVPPSIPLKLTFRSVFAEELIGVRWDVLRHEWVRIEKGFLADEDSHTATVSQMGTYALVRPDTKPVKPYIPELGEALTGVAEQPIPEGATVELLSSPETLFMQTGAHSELQIGLKDTEAFPSGTRIEVEAREYYHRRDGSLLSPEPLIKDLILFQEKTGLLGRLKVSPSEIFEPVLLESGVISIDVYPPDTEEAAAIIGATGGEITTADGIAMKIPSGAVTRFTPVSIRPLHEPESPLQEDSKFTLVGGVKIDLGGAVLNTSARLRVELKDSIPKDSQILAVRPVRVQDLTRYELVGIGAVKGRTLTISGSEAKPPLPGIRTEGRYYFVRLKEAVGYLTGSVKSEGEKLGRVLVGTDQLPFISLADNEDSRYVLAVPTGAVSAYAKDLTDGRSATVIKAVKGRGATLTADLLLEEFRPSIISTTPDRGANKVPTTTPIRVRFSERIDPTTITANTFKLRADKKEISGALNLLPDGATVVLRTDALLAPETVHTIELSPLIRDIFGNPLFGNQPDDTFAASFVTVDTTPPPPPEAGQITAGTPVDGVSKVSGTQGTVEPGVVVTVKNTATGVLSTVIASDDGSFSVSISAGLTDDLELLLLDEAGNETTIDIGRVTPPPGVAVLGQNGGEIHDKKGVGANIPAGFLPQDTIVKIEPLDIKGIPHPFSKELPGFIAGAASFNMSGVELADTLELRFSIDGLPDFDTIDLIPLFRIEREITLPDHLQPGTELIFRLQGKDLNLRFSELKTGLPIVADSPNTTPRTVNVPGTPTLRLTLPTEVTPGEKILISAAADPPDIKLRFPASPILTGNEQFLLFEITTIGGRDFWSLVDKATLKTLEDGRRVIETSSPPFRGIQKDTERLVMAVFNAGSLAYVPILSPFPASDIGAATDNLQISRDKPRIGQKLKGRIPTDRSTHEAAIVPVKAGTPANIEVIDLTSNERIYKASIKALPPDSLASVLVLGEDDNDLFVTGTTSQANYAVPVDAAISISFSHLIETTTLTEQTLFIEEETKGGQWKRVPTDRKFRKKDDQHAYIVTVKPRSFLKHSTHYRLVAPIRGIRRPGMNGKPLASHFELLFTSAPSFKIIGKKEIDSIKTFDMIDDVALVTQRKIEINDESPSKTKIVNRFLTIDLSDPKSPKIMKETAFEGGEYKKNRSDLGGEGNGGRQVQRAGRQSCHRRSCADHLRQ